MSPMGNRPFSKSALKIIRHIFNPPKLTTYRAVPSFIPLPPYVNSGVITAPKLAEIKTHEQIEQMRPACKLAASILQAVGENIKIGMKTDDIDEIVHSKCVEAGAYPSPLQYKGYPKSVCTSVNEVACHGIPSSQSLEEGDIINVDITVFLNGYHGDTSSTFMVGNVSERNQALVQAAKECRDAAIKICCEGVPFSNIGDIIYTKACEMGFEVIPCFCGHGIGEYFHGPPDIVHVPSDCVGDERMMAGMTFTIEPILCDGEPGIKILDDGWTVITSDKSRSAQFEHTILITKDGSEILTQ